METTEIKIHVFYGSLSDLTKIDLRFINAQIQVFKGRKFKSTFKRIFPKDSFERNYKLLTDESISLNLILDEEVKLYAIVPLDISKPFNNEHIEHLYSLLLAYSPSDLSIVKTITLILKNSSAQVRFSSHNKFISSGDDYYDNFLHINSVEYKFLNRYLSTYFHKSLELNYVRYILSVYTNSFFELNPIYQFISLMICLEVIVDGKEQLTYKLKRNIAILCGETIEHCRNIYTNIDQLYKLRCAIVHGEIKPSYTNFQEYHKYLKMITARLIRELIIHNIPTVADLNIRLTEIGYSQNKLLSSNYTYSKYPIIDYIELKYQKIQKYK